MRMFLGESPRSDACAAEPAGPPQKGVVTLLLEVRGVRSVGKLISRLSEIEGVVAAPMGADGSSPE